MCCWGSLQPSKDCVQKTLKRLEDKIQGKVLNQILYSMNTSDRIMQHRTTTALARLAREQDLETIFIDRKGLDILISILTDSTRDPTTLREAAGALSILACPFMSFMMCLIYTCSSRQPCHTKQCWLSLQAIDVDVSGYLCSHIAL